MRDQTLETVMAKIRSVFPNRPESEIFTQLQAYGVESYEHEKHRVYLAILKLCEEEHSTDPMRYIDAAKRDYRDVLYWAEYPNEAKSPTWKEKDPEKIKKIRKLDREQYNNWLSKT